MGRDQWLVDVFLGLGVACQFICCLGVAVYPNVFDRLHFVGAGSIFGPLLVGAAVLVRATDSSAGIETIALMVFMATLGPVLVIATGRAARRLDYGSISAGEAREEAG